jgi:hypothetical protein
LGAIPKSFQERESGFATCRLFSRLHNTASSSRDIEKSTGYSLFSGMEVPDRGLRLLALDGGGVRGLSALVILKELMLKIDPNCDPKSPPKPCDYFDLIGGTSTGGLVTCLNFLEGSNSPAIQSYCNYAWPPQNVSHRLH